MLQTTARGLVGLIVIETHSHERVNPPEPCGGHDSTLSGYLAYLAAADVPSVDKTAEEAATPLVRREPAHPRFAHRGEAWGPDGWSRPARISADLSSLTAHLDDALRLVRCQIDRAIGSAL